MARAALRLLLLWLLALTGAGARPPDADLLVLEVRLDGHVLSDSFSAYADGPDVLLPLGELARLLTLGITVRADAGSAAGFVVREDRVFGLNLAESLASVNGRDMRFEPRLAQVVGDDILVSHRLLARWLPLDLDVDLPTLELRVRPRVHLPLQERLARQQAGSRLGNGRVAPPEGGHPRVDAPYRLLDFPFVDQTLAQELRRTGSQAQQTLRYTALATADLLGMEGAAYFSADTQGRPVERRATLSRHDPEGGLLGPLDARSVVLGNVLVPSVPHVMPGSPAGNGIALGNRPLARPTGFDRHSLRGDLPPGWDVTLYFNDALVGYQQAGADGRYAFDDLPLQFGMNEFRLVFNGPLGQVRVERQRFLLDQSLVKPGEWVWQFAQHRASGGGLRTVAQVDLGLARGLAANAGWVRKPDLRSGAAQGYGLLGLRAYADIAIASAQLTAAQAGGWVADLGLKTRLFGTTLDYVRTERRRGFASDLLPAGPDALVRRDRLRADGTVPGGWLPPLTLGVEAVRDEVEDGARNLGLLSRASTFVAGTSVTQGLRWGRVGGAVAADGTLQLARRVADVGLNLQLGWAMRPQAALQTLALSTDHALASGWRVNGGLLRAMDSGLTVGSFGVSRSVGPFGLAINGSWSNRHELTLALQLSMAMGRDPRSGAWAAEALPMAGTGAVSARAFLDRNMNGTWDDGEEPIANAGFVLNGGGRHPALTRADGSAFIGRLMPAQYTDITLDPATLDDPQWRPLLPGVRVLARPGRTQEVDFPVIATAEVEGMVHLSGRGPRRPVGDAHIELVGADGGVVAFTRSSPDGYWLLHQVPPGRYVLRVSPEQAARLKLDGALERTIDVSADGDFIGGQDFELVVR